jgi:quercetin dioxygenase-like cupin family protein
MKPYAQNKKGNEIIREFSAKVNSMELVWHRDLKDREIEVLGGDGWLLQLDNELPKELKVGDKFKIKKEVYHRIKRGNSNLKIKIIEK